MVLAAPDRDTTQWSADSLGRSEIEEVSEGFSYGANTIRDGVSLTPRRELRALALPSEIMRLPNLDGYLKFPGPFPVASIRLRYVSRPKAAERFVPREGDGADPRTGAEGAGNDGIAIPEPSDPDDPHSADGSGAPGMPPEPAAWQGELDLVPLPGEAGDPQLNAATGETEPGKAADAGGTPPAQATKDGAPDAGPEPANPPRSSDAGAGRGSDWG